MANQLQKTLDVEEYCCLVCDVLIRFVHSGNPSPGEVSNTNTDTTPKPNCLIIHQKLLTVQARNSFVHYSSIPRSKSAMLHLRPPVSVLDRYRLCSSISSELDIITSFKELQQNYEFFFHEILQKEFNRKHFWELCTCVYLHI